MVRNPEADNPRHNQHQTAVLVITRDNQLGMEKFNYTMSGLIEKSLLVWRESNVVFRFILTIDSVRKGIGDVDYDRDGYVLT